MVGRGDGGNAAETFHVLVLKSTIRLPYTSVFLELDCGYWSPDAEARLRSAMDAKQTHPPD